LALGNHLTLIHGDAHYGNILLPKDPASHALRPIDWQCWEVRVGTDDLAFQMGLWWFPFGPAE